MACSIESGNGSDAIHWHAVALRECVLSCERATRQLSRLHATDCESCGEILKFLI